MLAMIRDTLTIHFLFGGKLDGNAGTCRTPADIWIRPLPAKPIFIFYHLGTYIQKVAQGPNPGNFRQFGQPRQLRAEKGLVSYVFTNPPPDTVLNHQDLVYVLRPGGSEDDDE